MTEIDVDARPEADAVPTAPVRRRWREGTAGAWVFRLALVALLVAPWAIGLGMEKAGENRAETAFPSVALGSLSDTDTFRQTDQALKDRLPLKTAVVRLVGDLSVATGQSFTTRVVAGTDGTPFTAEEFVRPCDRPIDASGVNALLEGWRETTRDQGGDVLMVIAPDKASIERDRLGPFANDLLSCSDATREQVVAEWGGREDSVLLPLWSSMAERARQESDLYQRGDTHWTGRGAAVMAAPVVARFAPEDSGIDFAAERFDADWEERPGDLYALMGAERNDLVPRVVAKRPGLTLERERKPGTTAGGIRYDTLTSAKGAPLIPGRTLIIADSFYDRVDPMLRYYFEDAVRMHWSDLAAMAEAGTALPKSDRILFETAQRFTADRFEVLENPEVQRAIDEAIAKPRDDDGPVLNASR